MKIENELFFTSEYVIAGIFMNCIYEDQKTKLQLDNTSLRQLYDTLLTEAHNFYIEPTDEHALDTQVDERYDLNTETGELVQTCPPFTHHTCHIYITYNGSNELIKTIFKNAIEELGCLGWGEL